MNKGHDFGADCWSLGVLIFELLTGKSVRNGSPTSKSIQYVSKGWATEKCCKSACYNCVICVHIFMSILPSILSVFYNYPIFYLEMGCGGSSNLSRETSFSPATLASSSLRYPKLLSGQQRDIVSLKCPGSSQGPSTGHALNTSHGRRPGGIWTRCLSHLIRLLSTNSWEEQRLYLELLLNDRACHPS